MPTIEDIIKNKKQLEKDITQLLSKFSNENSRYIESIGIILHHHETEAGRRILTKIQTEVNLTI